jgi:hypothetical protein
MTGKPESLSQPPAGQPITTWRAYGTKAFPGWILGARVSRASEMQVGEVYLEDAVELNALNLIKIITRSGPPLRPKLLSAIYVNPEDASQVRLEGDDDFEIYDPAPSEKVFYRVERSA